jgi:hypothetical protein
MHLFEAKKTAQEFANAMIKRLTYGNWRNFSGRMVPQLISSIIQEGVGAGLKTETNREDFIMVSSVPKADTSTSQEEEVKLYANEVYEWCRRLFLKVNTGPAVRAALTKQNIINGFLTAYGYKPLKESTLTNMKLDEDFSELFDSEEDEYSAFPDELSFDAASDDQFDYLNDEEEYPVPTVTPEMWAHSWMDDDAWEEEQRQFGPIGESFNAVYEKSRLQEGGPRKNMSQETIDRFVHELLLVPDATRRQEIVDEIFEKIAEENAKAYEKSQKKLNATEQEVKDEVK